MKVVGFETQVKWRLLSAPLSLGYEAQIRIYLRKKGNQMNIDTTIYRAYPKSNF